MTPIVTTLQASSPTRGRVRGVAGTSDEWASNLPLSGYTLARETTFSTLSPSGWNTLPAGAGSVTVASDAGPYLGTSLRFTFPEGQAEGFGGSTRPSLTGFTNIVRMFSCMVWKLSPNWQNHPVGTKLIYPFRANPSGVSTRCFMWGVEPITSIASGKSRIALTQQSSAPTFRTYRNNQSPYSGGVHFEHLNDTWYMTEIETIHNTPGLENGVYREWVRAWNGSSWGEPILTCEHTNVGYSSTGDQGRWTIWEIDAYMGGQGGTGIPADQYFSVNRAAIYVGEP
jgi:hypothetical protein